MTAKHRTDKAFNDMVDSMPAGNFGLLPAARLWLTETFVALRNIYAGDTKVL